jgi:hypothetical protein
MADGRRDDAAQAVGKTTPDGRAMAKAAAKRGVVRETALELPH